MLTPSKATDLLETYGHRALDLARSVQEAQLGERRLIKRFRGIEDSSRNWSVLMTIHHLLITGESMAGIAEKLAAGDAIETVVRIENVKPKADVKSGDILASYELFLGGYRQRVQGLLSKDLHMHRHVHPWFGAINAHQWLCLNALHHRIHLTQIQRIIMALGKQSNLNG
jgi:hypothetical protein